MAAYDITTALTRVPINPESFQRVGLEFLSSKLNGDEIVDVNSPVVHLLEVSSSQSAYHIQENFALDRKHYALLSQTYDQLYGHMANADYLDRFSTPGQATVQYVVHYESLLAAMVTVPDTNIKRVVIPRYTSVRPGGEFPLLLLYPIEIRQLPHDGIQVVFNTETTTPIQTLADNVLDHYFLKENTGSQDTYLRIDIPMYQLTRTRSIEDIVVGTSRFAYSFSDNYFFTRVFQGDTGSWSELETTHSLQVFDANKPTALIQVADGVVNITIPPIYYSNNTVSGKLRVDIYTTLGNVVQDFTNYDPAKYSVIWGTDDDQVELSDYSSSVNTIPYSWVSTDTLAGGANGLTFEELRERVIFNAKTDIENSPVTPAQIKAKLNLLGFDILKSRDDLTDRLYLATSDMATPNKSLFNSGIGVTIGTVQTSIDTAVKYTGVYDNGERITIGPNALFKMTSGLIAQVDNSQRPEVLYKTPEAMVNGLNQSNYLFTPYHYVLDATDDQFSLRPYYLENPKQTARRFIDDNPSLLIEVSTTGYEIKRTTTGYRLTVTLTAGDTYLAIAEENRHIQLAFIPYGETTYAYINGTLLGTTGKTVLWAFDIETNFDLDTNNNLVVTNFNIFEAATRSLALGLETEFLLLTAVSGDVDPGYQYSAIDGLLADYLLPEETKGITEEFVTIQLGTSLGSLWAGARTLEGSYEYKVYDTDIPATYTEDVYKYDSQGIPVFEVINNEAVVQYAHRAGEIKYDDTGAVIYLHKKGDTILDAAGNPVPLSARPVIHLIDLFFIDGNYKYVTRAEDLSDLTWTANDVANTQLTRLKTLGNNVLEKTNVYLYPKKSIGPIDVLIDDGINTQVTSSLTFSVKFYLTGSAYRDIDYRNNLETLTAKIFNNGIKTETVSVSTLVTLLKPELDENVVGFDINMYSDGNEMTTFMLTDSSMKPSIQRIIEYTQEGKYAIKENIEFSFKNRDRNTTTTTVLA